MEESKSAFKILTGKPTGRRLLEGSRRRWEVNIIMNFKEKGVNTRDWVIRIIIAIIESDIETPGSIRYKVVI